MSDLLNDGRKAKKKADTLLYFFEALGGYFLDEDEIGTYLVKEKTNEAVLLKATKELHFDFFPDKYLSKNKEKESEQLVKNLKTGDKELWAYLLGLVENYSNLKSTRFPEVKSCSPFAEDEIWIVELTIYGVDLPSTFPEDSMRKKTRDYFIQKENPDHGIYLIVRSDEEELSEDNVYFVQSFEPREKAL